MNGELVVIGADTDLHAITDGAPRARGCVPRDYMAQPHRAYEALSMPLIPRGEWAQRIKDMAAAGRRLTDIRLRSGPDGGRIPALDQGQNGYCWAHSGTMAAMLSRAAAGMPYVALSAYAVAATIKNGRNEGGWGAQGLDFIAEKGVPDQSFWAQGDRDYRKDRPGCWENALLHRAAETWADVAAPQYSRNLSFDQVATCLLCGVPVVADYNFWSHSICLLDLVDGASQRSEARAGSGKLMTLQAFDTFWGMDNADTGGFGVDLLNSWADSWGKLGIGRLAAAKASPDGACALRSMTASEV